MFELNLDQVRMLEALLSPFGLIVVVQAGKWLARRVGAEIGRGQVRIFLAALSAALAYFWWMPSWPSLPLCAEIDSCVSEISLFAGALVALGSAWFGAAHFIYEKLAKSLFEQLGINQ